VFDVLDDLEAAIDKVAAEVGDLDVARMCRLADRVDFLRLRAIGTYDRSLAWRTEGFLSAASGVRAKTRLTRGQAYRAVDLARKLADLPEAAEAFAVGEITKAHADVIADGYTPERAEMIRGVEAALVDNARLADPASCAAPSVA
jgi:hypothetical protein